MSNPADEGPGPDKPSTQRLRISIGDHMVFTEDATSITMTMADGTLRLEATYTPTLTEAEQPTEQVDAPPGWADDNPGLDNDDL